MELIKHLAVAAALTALPAAANIALPVGDDIIPNFFGVGVGNTTQWHGASERTTAALPGMRVNFDKGRFLEWYGPYVGVNLIPDSKWEAGPVLNIRMGRNNVDNEVIAELPEFSAGLELGGYVGWSHVNTEGIPYRLRFGITATTTVAGETDGSNVTPYGSIWIPLSETLFFGLGGGFTWGDDAFMDQYFGVDPNNQAGLEAYDPEAGVRQAYIWPALMWRIDPKWMLATGAFYQRLTDDAADSPIVREEGDKDQWTVGVGIGYLW